MNSLHRLLDNAASDWHSLWLLSTCKLDIAHDAPKLYIFRYTVLYSQNWCYYIGYSRIHAIGTSSHIGPWTCLALKGSRSLIELPLQLGGMLLCCCTPLLCSAPHLTLCLPRLYFFFHVFLQRFYHFGHGLQGDMLQWYSGCKT